MTSSALPPEPPTPSNPRMIDRDSPPSRFEFDDLRVGATIIREVSFDPADIDAFSELSDDFSRIHHDAKFARSVGYADAVVHGHLATAPFSVMIGSHLPGEGCVIRRQSFEFRQPVYCGAALTYRVEVERLRPRFQLVELGLSAGCGGVNIVTGKCECLPAGGHQGAS